MSKSKNGAASLFDEVDYDDGLPQGWCYATVEDVMDECRYGSSSKTSTKSTGVPVLRMGNIQNCGLDFTKLKYLPEDHEEFPKLFLRKGDLLFNRTNSAELVGKSAVYGGAPSPCSYASYLIGVRLGPTCDPKYLSFCINSAVGKKWIKSVVSQQVGQANVNGTKLKAFRFPLAPPKEQKRIVSKIEELFLDLDAGVSALERARANLRRYRASVLKSAVEGRLTQKWRNVNKANPDVEPASELLARILRERRQRWEQQQLATYESKSKKPAKNWQSKYKEPAAPDTANLPELPERWCWATVPQVAESCLGKMLDKNKHIEGEKLPYLRNVNVRWRSVDTTDLREMFFKPGDEDRFGLEPGDVLVCEGGEPGRAAVWRGQVENMRFQKAIHRVRCGTGLLPEYLVVVLESFAKSGLLERLFTGTTIKHFTGVSLAKMQLPFPPFEEQERIVELADATVAETMRCNAEIRVNLKRSERLRQSILKRAFEGQLLADELVGAK